MSKHKKIVTIVFLLSFFILSLIGYIFHIDFLIPFLIKPNGFFIGWVSLVVSLVITLIVEIILKIIKPRA